MVLISGGYPCVVVVVIVAVAAQGAAPAALVVVPVVSGTRAVTPHVVAAHGTQVHTAALASRRQSRRAAPVTTVD